MADIQFTIKESLAPRQAKLAIPVFTKGKSQLDPISVKKKGNCQCAYKAHYQMITWWAQDKAHVQWLISWLGIAVQLQIFVHQLYLLIELSINRPYSMALVYQLIPLGRYISLFKMLY